jgi:hypothetical protein
MGFSATQAVNFSNISLGTASIGTLKGGKYALIVSGTITSVQLQALSLDGTTWVNYGTALTAAGAGTFDLPPGTYRLSGTASALYASLVSIPT